MVERAVSVSVQGRVMDLENAEVVLLRGTGRSIRQVLNLSMPSEAGLAVAVRVPPPPPPFTARRRFSCSSPLLGRSGTSKRRRGVRKRDRLIG